jgi:hypothetical protein
MLIQFSSFSKLNGLLGFVVHTMTVNGLQIFATEDRPKGQTYDEGISS